MTISRRTLLGSLAAFLVAPLGMRQGRSPRLEFDENGDAQISGDFDQCFPHRQVTELISSINTDWFFGHAPGTVMVLGIGAHRNRESDGRYHVFANLRKGQDVPPEGLSMLTPEQWRKVYNRMPFANSLLAKMKPA